MSTQELVSGSVRIAVARCGRGCGKRWYGALFVEFHPIKLFFSILDTFEVLDTNTVVTITESVFEVLPVTVGGSLLCELWHSSGSLGTRRTLSASPTHERGARTLFG